MTKASQTRQFIIETTAPIFNKKGYFATSIADITNATGLTKGGIYGNFKDKDELALEVYSYNSKKLFIAIQQELAKENTAFGKLLAFLNFYRKNHEPLSQNGGCPIMNASTEADDTLPLLKARTERSFEIWKQLFVTIFNEGIAKKEFQSDINVEEYAVLFVAMIEGGVLLFKTSDNPKSLLTVLDRIERIIEGEVSL